ncbi:hypothetical protein [Streptomyces sp. CS113]|nr:hypothetical protein [Streptomyces sp. CS113]
MTDDGTDPMTIGEPAAIGDRARPEPPSAHEEQFRWVVAALGARPAG